MIVPAFLLAATAILAASTSLPDAPDHDALWREVTDGCGQSKSCFLYPDGCMVTQDCLAVVSILVVGKTYTFEMQAVGGVYVGLGLSEDIRMGNDSVVECVSDSAAAEGKLSLYASFNKRYSNTREPEATGITLDDEASSYDPVTKTAICKFTREEVTTFQDMEFDLDKTQYHLVLVVGSQATDTGLLYHDIARPYTEDKRFLADIGYFHYPRP